MDLVEINNKNLMGQFSNLLNQAFGVPAHSKFLDDFPVWDNELQARNTNRFGIIQNDRLIACTGVRLADLKLRNDNSTIKIGIIGAVATHPLFRGRGFASHLINTALDSAKSDGAQLIVLWSSEVELYRRLGFEPFGKQVRIPIGIFQSQKSSEKKIHEGWCSNLFPLIQKRNYGLVLTEDDRKWYEAHKNVKWYYSGPKEQPTAYAAFGRGIDLPGLVHEWRGDKEDVLNLFNEIYHRHTDASILAAPFQLEEFQSSGKPKIQNLMDVKNLGLIEEPLCMIYQNNSFQHLSLENLFQKIWFWGLDAA